MLYLILVLCCLLGVTHPAVDLDSEQEALQFVFGSDAERHTGVERLHFHEEHLKAAVRVLRTLNHQKDMNINRRYLGIDTFGNLDEDWKMFDIILKANEWAQSIGLKWDTYSGDGYFLQKIRRYTTHANYVDHVQRFSSLYGNDYLKYYVRNPNFNYTIQDARGFVDAMMTFTGPQDLMAKTGMTHDQLHEYAEGYRTTVMLHREQLVIPMLTIEIAQQMQALGLLQMNTPQHPPRSS